MSSSTTSSEPFYVALDGPDGARFRATTATAGPWSATLQHVGPPSALLARAVERCAPRPELQPVRVAVEVLGPVPVGEVAVTADVVRTGRSVELVAAELAAAGRTVLSARVWRTAIGDTASVAGPAVTPPVSPAELPATTDPAEGWIPGYLDAMEWRPVHGGLGIPGDAVVWARQRVPLVDDEEPTSLQRLLAIADSGNGVSHRLDIADWLFVNTDLTVHLHRPPVGSWFCLDAHTVVGPTGAGTAISRLFDEQGHVGRGVQALVVRPR